MWALPQPVASGTRLGLAVGTQAGGAVDRNRMRRRVRAVVRELDLLPGDVVVRGDSAAVDLSFQDLEEHLRRALRGAGMAPS